MHPALSVIFFTVLSGFGYGLFMALAVSGIFDRGFDSEIAIAASIVGLVLVTGGLLSSTLHLANPKNAWRAFSRFRTSWLSREGVFAIAFYPPALLYLGCWWFDMHDGWWWIALSLLILALALATVFSTGMIYGCLKTIRQWHTPLTPTNYILLSIMSGLLLFLFLYQLYAGGDLPVYFIAAAIAAVVWAGTMHFIYYILIIARSDGPTVNTATGLKQARVRLLDVGHTAGTFLTDEFSYRVAAGRLLQLRLLAACLAFLVPTLLLAFAVLGLFHNGLFAIALVSAFVGIFTERWLFFAQARHVVNLYHGAQRT